MNQFRERSVQTEAASSTITESGYERETPPFATADPIGRRSPRDLPCHVHDPDLWFAESPGDLERAKALCTTCPVQRECLASALRRREPCGVWGGQIVQRGRIVPFKRPRGRPRIHFPVAGETHCSRKPVSPTGRHPG